MWRDCEDSAINPSGRNWLSPNVNVLGKIWICQYQVNGLVSISVLEKGDLFRWKVFTLAWGVF